MEEYEELADNDIELRLCSICMEAESRSGLNSCLSCYVQEQHRIKELAYKPIISFSTVIEPITNTLSEAMAKIESYKGIYDYKLTEIDKKAYIVGYIKS